MSLFTDHPNSIGESYFQHLFFAVGIGAKLIGAGMAAIIHGLFPFWHQTTASRTIRDLFQRTAGRGVVPANPTQQQDHAA